MSGRRVLFSAQKNEGPFILEWVAFHKIVGFTDIIVVSNDCSDGSDELLDELSAAGFLTHIRQDVPEGCAPQVNAERIARESGYFRDGDWVLWLDLDEYLNVHIGSGKVTDLITATPNADAVGIAWRLFGDSNRAWAGRQLTSAYTSASKKRLPQNETIKTLTKMSAKIRKLELHRPAFSQSTRRADIEFVHSGGGEVPEIFFRPPFRDGTHIARLRGVRAKHILAQVNHYMVRSPDAFARKRRRGNGAVTALGRSPKDDLRSTDEFYVRSNRNEVEDRTVLRHATAAYHEQERIERTLSPSREDPPICCDWWDETPNFGDLLGPITVEQMTGRRVIKPTNEYTPILLSVGSILTSLGSHRRIIWGSGALRGNARAIRSFYSNRVRPDIRAVRGALTANVVSRALEISQPRVLGDPALLAPKYLDLGGSSSTGATVICPHFTHYEAIRKTFRDSDKLEILDVRDPPLSVVRSISEASICISTSLHGLIIAQAYGVPWCWLRIEDRQLAGRDFKFNDFFSTLSGDPGIHSVESIFDLTHIEVEAAKRTSRVLPLAISLADLENAFPYDVIESRFNFASDSNL